MVEIQWTQTGPRLSTYDLVGSERDVLPYYLNKNRRAVVHASEGLKDEQQRTPGVPSGTNLLGMIRHITGVEAHWFRRVFADEDPGTPTTRHADLLRELIDGSTVD